MIARSLMDATAGKVRFGAKWEAARTLVGGNIRAAVASREGDPRDKQPEKGKRPLEWNFWERQPL